MSVEESKAAKNKTALPPPDYNSRITFNLGYGFIFLVLITTLLKMKENAAQNFSVDKIPQLQNSNAHMKDKSKVEEKLKILIRDGKEKLQIITDFDRTLSKYHHDGELTKSSYCVYETIPTLPKNFLENANALYNKFRVIEDDPNLTVEEKLPHMKEWWNLNEKLFIGLQYNEKEIEEAVKNSGVMLREGTNKAFEILDKNNIPVLVFSAGLGDVVKSIMKYHNIYSRNVKIISNFFSHTDKEINGFQGTLIHIYNKNEHAIENCGYFKELSHRRNVILMGDSLGDANMAEGVPGEGVILKIGLLSVNIEEYLPQYLDQFDIVLTDDQTMDIFNAILNFVL